MKTYFSLKINNGGQVAYLALFGPGAMARPMAEAFGQPVPQVDPEASWLWVPKLNKALLFPDRAFADIIAEFAGPQVSVVSVLLK